MDKMRDLKLYRRQICLLIVISLNICCGSAPKPNDAEIQETKRIWQTIPIYPEMTETGSGIDYGYFTR